MNSTPGNSEEVFDNIINENNNNENIIIKESSKKNLCKVCYEEVIKDEHIFNSLPCGHLCCNQCWLN